MPARASTWRSTRQRCCAPPASPEHTGVIEALRLTASWPVPTVAAACVLADGTVDVVGDERHEFRLASISKMLTGWAALIAVEEAIVTLDEAVGQPGCTL